MSTVSLDTVELFFSKSI